MRHRRPARAGGRQLYALLLCIYLAYDPQADPLETMTAFCSRMSAVTARAWAAAPPAAHRWMSRGRAVGRCGRRPVLPGLPHARKRSPFPGANRLDVRRAVRRAHTTKNTGAGSMFDLLRRYVEGRLETPGRAGRLGL